MDPRSRGTKTTSRKLLSPAVQRNSTGWPWRFKSRVKVGRLVGGWQRAGAGKVRAISPKSTGARGRRVRGSVCAIKAFLVCSTYMLRGP